MNIFAPLCDNFAFCNERAHARKDAVSPIRVSFLELTLSPAKVEQCLSQMFVVYIGNRDVGAKTRLVFLVGGQCVVDFAFALGLSQSRLSMDF